GSTVRGTAPPSKLAKPWAARSRKPTASATPRLAAKSRSRPSRSGGRRRWKRLEGLTSSLLFSEPASKPSSDRPFFENGRSADVQPDSVYSLNSARQVSTTSGGRSADAQRTVACEAAAINPPEVSNGSESCGRCEGSLRQSEGHPVSIPEGSCRVCPGIDQRGFGRARPATRIRRHGLPCWRQAGLGGRAARPSDPRRAGAPSPLSPRVASDRFR